jgi:hypothetical protein
VRLAWVACVQLDLQQHGVIFTHCQAPHVHNTHFDQHVYVHLHMCMWSCSMKHLATHALCDACRVLGPLAAVSTRASAACSHHNIDVPCDEPPWMQSDAAEQHAARQAAACPMAAGWQEAVVGRLMWHAACSRWQRSLAASLAHAVRAGAMNNAVMSLIRSAGCCPLGGLASVVSGARIESLSTCATPVGAGAWLLGGRLLGRFWLLCTRQVHLKVRNFAQIPIA